MKRFGFAFLAICLMVAMCAATAAAQRTTGTIRGTVADPSGAMIPGAEVVLHSEATGLERRTRSDDTGNFAFADVPPGRYRLTVIADGFKQHVQTGVELSVAGHVVLTVALEVGTAVETVTVTSTQFAVELTSGEVSGLIQGQQVRELPLNGRSFAQLTTLMPGVSPAENFSSNNKGLFAGVDMSVSGGAPNANLWTVDGSNNNDVGSNRTILVYPSIDAIEEFRIHRNSYGPEFGQAAGAQVNIVTRGGSNEFHGSAYYFGRNDKLNATDYFLNLAGQPKAALRRNDFGYTFGGPVVKDKLFFFWSQEWNLERRGVVNSALVPTLAERAGNFSASTLSGCNPVPIDPATGAAFAGNTIPTNRLSPGGLLMMQLYAEPNIAPTASNPCPNPNWVGATKVPVDWRQENIRGDYKISDSTSLMVRYTQDSWENGMTAGDANGLWGDDAFPAVDSAWRQPGRVLTASLNQTFGAGIVNSFQFSYSANRIKISRGTGADLVNQINAAIPTIFPVSDKTFGDQRTHPVFWGAQGYAALWHLAPWDNSQDLFVWKDDFSMVRGRHIIKAGFLGSVNKKDEIVAQPEEVSALWGPATGFADNAWGGGTGNVIADFLLRDTVWGFGENQRARDVQQRWRDIEFYVGDTWRATSRLTLDAGLRWSFFRNPYVANDELASFVPSLFNASLGASPCNGLLIPPGSSACDSFPGGTEASNRSLVSQKNNLIAPRFGLAWDVFGDGKTAVRMGLGQFFLREMLNPSLLAAGFNSPFNAFRGELRTLDSAAAPPGTAFFGGNGLPAWGLDPKGLNPNTWQWNVTVERELWRDAKWEIGYVGNRGIHLLKRIDINQVPPANRLAFVRTGGEGSAGLRPFGSTFGANSAIVFFTNAADSNYHSLQTMFQMRFHRGSIFRANYTFSRMISTDPNAGGSFNNAAAFSDNTNFRLDRGLAELHRPHLFTADLIYYLPTFDNLNAFARNTVGGWQVSTITQFLSGPAITITQGPITGVNGLAGTGIADNQRPNRVWGTDCRASGGAKHQWLNPAAFTFVGYQLGTPGNSPRGACLGPGTANWDIALMKNWDIGINPSRVFGESIRVQFRIELFNAFNTPQFRGVDPGLGATTITFDTGSLATANTVTAFTPQANFGRAARTRGPREIQYGLKITW